MVPIWKKQKSEVTDEEYASFYKDKFNDYADPARVIVSRTEGTANYNALLFVPSHRPYDFYTKDYEKGLDRKSTRLNSSHPSRSRMPSSA